MIGYLPETEEETGITGQDGVYFAEFILHKGYEAYGIKRRASPFNTARIDRPCRGPHEAEVRCFLRSDKLNDWQPPIKSYSRGLTH